MRNNPLVILSKEFSVDIVRLCTSLKDFKISSILLNQLLRCATSIGANIHEGNYASSRADFINKFKIALKECYETEYWLDIFKDSEIIAQETHTLLIAKCYKLRKMLSASIVTAKSNTDKY